MLFICVRHRMETCPDSCRDMRAQEANPNELDPCFGQSDSTWPVDQAASCWNIWLLREICCGIRSGAIGIRCACFFRGSHFGRGQLSMFWRSRIYPPTQCGASLREEERGCSVATRNQRLSAIRPCTFYRRMRYSGSGKQGCLAVGLRSREPERPSFAVVRR